MGKRNKPTSGTSRRSFLKAVGLAAPVLSAPWVWVPKSAFAQTAQRGDVKHLLYVRLSGGFRFTTAFNGDVASEFNPFSLARGAAPGTEWGPSRLLEEAPFLADDEGEALAALGMQPVHEFSNEIMVLPCVDHEPAAGSADGNHGSGLERFLTGTANGTTSFLTMVNYGVRQAVADALAQGTVLLPAFSFGDAGMARGFGDYAAYRPPVLQGDGFDRFGFDAEASIPAWARPMTEEMDVRHRDRLHPQVQNTVDSYIQSREATQQFSAIFNDPVLKIGENSTDQVDGISNAELNQIFGNSQEGRSTALALRLFRFGCPAAYINQGGYDFHSNEESRLPDEMADLNRLTSGVRAALKRMAHPSGGTYWQHTLVVFGSEFGRTARGGRFNSARGSDHGGDLATRWMSMPMMGGVVDSAARGGRSIGRTRSSDLVALGQVYSYRSILKLFLDVLGADHNEFFPADPPPGSVFG